MLFKVKSAPLLGALFVFGIGVVVSRFYPIPTLASSIHTPNQSAATRIPNQSITAPPPDSLAPASADFPNIWERANQARSYRFDAVIEQTYIPRAQAGMIGQQDQQVNLFVQGDVQRGSGLGDQGNRARINLRAEGAAGNAQPITLVEENGRTFIQRGDTLVPANGNVAGVSPVAPSNFLDYLAAASNVRPAADATTATLRSTSPTAPRVHYLFDIDNERLFQLAIDRAIRAGQPRPVMPAALRGMVASGEVWVGEDGLPRRQIITLNLARIDPNYDARVRMVLDLSSFGGVPNLPTLKPSGGGTYHIDPAAPASLPPSAAEAPSLLDWQNFFANLVLPGDVLNSLLLATAFTSAGVVILFWYRRRRKTAYAVIVIGLSTAIVLTSPLSAAQASQQRAQAEQALPLTQALGLVEAPQALQERADANQALRQIAAPAKSVANAPALTQTADPTPKCGDFAPGADTDGEGLTDQQEACLGTNPRNYDTDKDGVTDAQEVFGFDCAGKRWTTDPLNPDSNRDGVADSRQYPNTISDGGTANCDTDGDGTPDVWDTDNDNDGMPNKFDLSPEAKGATYTNTLKLQINPQGYTGTVYVELQVQPQNPNHLRYSTTALDWPNDDGQGQITDLDNSKDDLRLVPMLEIETNVASTELAARYGYNVREITSTTPPKTLVYVPLRPQSDGGGLNQAFYAKVPYTSAELTSTITWNARVTWMVQAKVDNYIDSCLATNAGAVASGRCTETNNKLVHVYRDEPFRLSGLNIVKSDRFESAVFGTPQTPSEDKDLFQVLDGLAATFLDYQQFTGQASGRSAIQEFAARFNTPNTPLDLRFQLPETVTVAVSTTVTPHQDAGIAATSDLVNAFLNQRYTSPSLSNQCRDTLAGQPFTCATVGILSEQRVGSMDLPALSQNSDGTYVASLSDIGVITQRNLKAVLYEQLRSGQWQASSTARTAALINIRYAGVLDQRVEEYSAFDPVITRDGLLMGLFIQYLAWTEGYSRVVEFDRTGLLALEPSSDEQKSIISSLNASRKAKDVVDQIKSIGAVLGAATSPTTPGGWIGTGVKKAGSLFEGTSVARPINIKVPSTSGGKLSFTSKTIFTIPAIEKFGAKALIAGSSVVLAASIAVAIAQSVCESKSDEDCTAKLEVAGKVVGSFEAITGAVSLIAAFGGLQKADFSKAGLKAGLLDSVGDGFGKAGAAFAVIGTLLTIGTAWAEFGLLSSSGAIQPGSAAYKLALARAIGSTIWAIIVLVLSFIPFGIGDLISAILGLVDTLISLISGGELDLATVVIRFFYDIKLLTELRDQAFTDTGTGWRDETLGLVVSNTFFASNSFTATIGPSEKGSVSDLTESNTYAEGYFVVSATNTLDPSAVQSNPIKGQRECKVAGGVMNCKNTLSAEFKLLKPGINTQLQFASYFDFLYLYKECIFACGVMVKTTSEKTTQPSSADDIEKVTQKITIDVLPASLDALWSWNLLKNPDTDGDGLTTVQETQLGTNPNNPDSDGDGLSDGYELNTSHTNPTQADMDGDGLSDGQENQYGTDPKRADSDADGLSDGEEIFHNIGNNTWQGGWLVTLPGNLQTRVFPDPLSSDGDSDGLADRSERTFAASPNAFNQAPRLFLDAQPLAVEPGGTPSVYVAPGERVTYTLFLSTGFEPITSTLTVCLPSQLTNITLGQQYGNRQFAPQIGTCAGNNVRYAFNFAGSNTLQIGEYISTTFVGTANPAATASLRGVAEVSVTTSGKVLSDTRSFTLDADKPGQPGIVPTSSFATAASQDTTASQEAADTSASAVIAATSPGILFSAPVDGAILRRAPGGTTYIVGGYASDATSWIKRVEIDTGVGAGYALATGTSPWAYAWQLPADGNYTLSARAIDQVDNISAITTTQVLVDGTSPTATLTIPGNGYVRPAANSTIVLNGTASDNLAGLSLIQISINNGTWTTLLAVPDTQSQLNANWSYTWTLPQSADASGTYLMKVRAIDRAGNESLPASSKLVVDGLPPTDDLTTNTYFNIPDVPANQPLALTGRANDLGNVPLPVRPTALAGTVSSILSATTWLQYGSVADDNAGVSIAWLGDVNGDGRADLGVGLPASGNGAGRAAIVYGRGGNWPVPPDAEAIFASPTSFVGAAGAGLGAQITSAGDVNGDNFYDVLIGDPVNNRAFLVFGRGAPLGASLPLTGVAASAAWNVLDVSGLGAFTAATSAGDVNGDSFGDLLISAGGKTYLLLGHSGAWYASTSVATEAAAVMPLPANATATGVGDVDKNGFADFVVTGPNVAYLVSGSATFAPRGVQSLTFPASAVGTLPSTDAIVHVTPLGDVNGDGLSDFIYSSGNAPRLVLGRQGGNWSFSLEFAGYNPAPSGFLAAPGDVNADGLNDIILGAPSNSTAYLILGTSAFPPSPNIQAIFTGVTAVASAPYAAGADLNCDISSDLLMMSNQAIASPSPVVAKGTSLFGADAFVSQQSLPAAPTVSTATVSAPGVRYVDDDYCGNPLCDNAGHTWLSNAFDSISAALIGALNGTRIVVLPGVYGPFTINANNITIEGVDADAVIVDGGGALNAVSIANTFNARLSNLTVRNATRLINLNASGQNYGDGNINSTYLDRLVLHSFTGNAIYMNNASSVEVQRSTIVGDSGSGPHIFVDRSTPDAYFPTPAWTTRGNLPANATSGSLLAATHNGASDLNLYALLNTAPITMQRYNTATNTWFARALPAGVTSVKGMAGGSVFLKAVMGDGVSNNLTYFYNPTTNVWASCTNAPFTPGTGFVMSEGNATQAAYVLAGGGTAFYLLNCITGWTSLAPIPLAPGVGAALVTQRSTGKVYALVGGNRPNFYVYDPVANNWTALPNAPFNANDGAGMAQSNGLWAFAGGGTNSMGYFDDKLAQWVSLPFAAPPGTIGAGGGVAAYGNALSGLPLVVMRGGTTNQVFNYGPTGVEGFITYYPPVKARFTSTTFVGPSTPSAITWLNTSRPQFDFDYVLDGVSQFVNGGTLSPTVPATQVVPFASAAFIDPTSRVYRLDTSTVLTSGYYTARGDAVVSALYCPTCANDGRTWGVDAFASVQAGIDSGALRVRILPGVYQERVHLVNGVQVIGSGAESTLIQAPNGLTPSCFTGNCPVGQYLESIPVVTADGIKAASLSRVSVVGLGRGGNATGLRASKGAAIKVSRTIFRDTANGILLDGSTTDVEIVNNTFANNSNGIVSINSAGLDVRNTSFSGGFVGILYNTSAVQMLRQYNHYSGLSYPLLSLPGNQPVAPNGPGEITVEPLFANPASNDFRLLGSSPLIDAGNPSDPVPPGAGRVDIGYSESGQAAFYASGTYCAQCANDGLIWQIDAFDKIQGALNAAAAYLRSIGCVKPTDNANPFAPATDVGLCDSRVVVGVGAGTYTERVSVPSYVHLAGVGADLVTINAQGITVPVTFNGVVHAQVSGLRITGAANGGSDAGVRVLGASNQITITRNLIVSSPGSGVRFEGGSSGAVNFNTVQATVDGLSVSGADTWATASDNIFSGGTGTALRAASGGSIQSRYNLMFHPASYAGVPAGIGDLTGQNPLFVSGIDFTLQPTSPAIDAADPGLAAAWVPVGGGSRADLGYKELVATPLTLLFGKLGTTPCYVGNSGVQQVEVGLTSIPNLNQPVTATLPSVWNPVTLATPGETASFWSGQVLPTTGLYRLYTRATDVLGNQETPTFDFANSTLNLYSGGFVADGTAPVVTLVAPANGFTVITAAFAMTGTASDYIGTRFSVATPYFEATVGGVTTRIAGDWVANGWNGSGPRTFRGVAMLPPGSYSMVAKAKDQAGNIGTSTPAANITLNAPTGANHVVAFLTPQNNGWTNQASVRISGAALFSSINGTSLVTLQVNGGTIVPATLADALATLTTWSADVPLNVGSNTLTARTSNGAGVGPASTLVVRRDNVAPAVAAPGSQYFTRTAVMTGTTTDADSGIEAVEVSLDGGYRWIPATVSGPNWSLNWTAAPGNQNTNYPARVRARDRAGNLTTVPFGVIVDDLSPGDFGNVTFNIALGARLTSVQSLVMTWTTPIDNSGIVTPFASIDQISQTVPAAVMAGTTLTTPLNLNGAWYAHLSARDRAGNYVNRNFGPWYLSTGQFCLNPQQPIVLDGKLDLAANEWMPTTFLDDDERPSFAGSPVKRDRQSLYTIWDANAFYVGWRGGWWAVDGTLFVYLNTGSAGTTQLITPTTGSNALPFAADTAVVITSKTEGTLYRFIAGAWQPQTGLTFVQSDLGDTELRVPLALPALNEVKLLTLAMTDSGEPWSVFPTTNPLNGVWPDAYRWQPICSVTEPNAGQPRGASVLTTLSSRPGTGTLLPPNSALTYVVSLDNREQRAVANTVITLTADAGLSYQSALASTGITCQSCVPGASQWRIAVPTLAANAVALITVTGQLAADLSAIPQVTTTLSARAGAVNLSGAQLTHLTDGTPPTVTLLLGEPRVVPVGSVIIDGLADDGNGIGVAQVEVKPTGSNTWQVVSGTTVWFAESDVPAGPTFALDVRATDQFSQTSAAQTFTFTVDTVSPTLSLNVPAIVSGTLSQVGGNVSDPVPVGQLMRRVDVQIDDIGEVITPTDWFAALVAYSATPTLNLLQASAAVQQWTFSWSLPDADGELYRVRARATDEAGNITLTDWQTTTVDSRPPVITVTTAVSAIVGAPSTAPLAGSVSDGSGVGTMRVRVYAPNGAASYETIVLNGTTWSWAPQKPLINGAYQLRIEATDTAGNVTEAGPYVLNVSGFAATLLITATVTAGNSPMPDPTAWTSQTMTVSFSCVDLVVSIVACSPDQVFADEGVYTATGTATNSLLETASVVVGPIRIDKTAPATTLTGQPTNPSAGGPSTFTFTGSDNLSGVSRFECQLDDGDFAPCSSAKDYGALPVGTHTFAVRAVDQAGNVDATPATFTWRITLAASVIYLPVIMNRPTGLLGRVYLPVAINRR